MDYKLSNFSIKFSNYVIIGLLHNLISANLDRDIKRDRRLGVGLQSQILILLSVYKSVI